MAPARKKKQVYGKGPIIPAGGIILDSRKRAWKLGKPFASGGFGRVYKATAVDGHVGGEVAVKMEPSTNGPLFLELHVYQRIAKPEMISKWIDRKGLSFLGIPRLLGFGLHTEGSVEQRFMVMPLFGNDLETYRVKHPKIDPKMVFSLAINCLNALEYMHSHNTVHADLKAENLMLESQKCTDLTKMVLCDFGLAKKHSATPAHKIDRKRCHDGTLIFTSLDAHHGAGPSYRGDVQILGYNLIYWLTASLPWLKYNNQPEIVMQEKEQFDAHIEKVVKSCLSPDLVMYAKGVCTLFEHVKHLSFVDKPDFDLLRLALSSHRHTSPVKPKKKLGVSVAKRPSLVTSSPPKTKSKRRKSSVGSQCDASVISNSDAINGDASPLLFSEDSDAPSESESEANKTRATRAKGANASAASTSHSPSTIIPGIRNMKTINRRRSSSRNINSKNGKALVIPEEAFGIKKVSSRKRRVKKVTCSVQTSPSLWT